MHLHLPARLQDWLLPQNYRNEFRPRKGDTTANYWMSRYLDLITNEETRFQFWDSIDVYHNCPIMINKVNLEHISHSSGMTKINLSQKKVKKKKKKKKQEKKQTKKTIQHQELEGF